MKPAGYATGQFGKWHLGPDLEWRPALRGFDEVFGFLGRGAHDYFKLDDPADPIYRGTTVVQEKGYLTDRLGEETCAFITKHKTEPFFAYRAFNAVHAPLQAPDDESAKFNTGNFERPQRLIPLLGGLLEEKRELALKLSPIELLRADSPAIFLAHGDADKVLSVHNAIPMRDAAQVMGVPVECIISKGAGHGFGGENSQPDVSEITRQSVAFFLNHLVPDALPKP